jgi:DNA-binding GntR family transcriptional regulator
MSRTPIRAALQALQQEGLATVGPRRQLEVATVTREERFEVVALRIAIETVVIRHLCVLRAAGELEDDDLDRIRLAIIKQERAAKTKDPMRFFSLDERLHLELAALSGLPTAHRFLAELGGFVRLSRIGLPSEDSEMEEILEDHRRLVDSIELGDSDTAVALATEHIRNPGTD